MAVGAMERFVAVEKSLDEVFAGFEVTEISNGIAEGISIAHEYLLTRLPVSDVDAEDDLRFVGQANLIAWLAGRVAGEEQKEPAVEGLGAFSLCKGDGEFGRLRRGDLHGEEEEGEERARDASGYDRETAHERILHGEKWQRAHE